MNKLKLILGTFIMLWMAACTDFVEPAIPYSNFDTGVYLRTIANKAANVNFFNMDNAKFLVVVEVVGENDGKGLAKEVDVLVKRRRGQSTTNEVKVRTIPGSEFGPYPERNFPNAPNRNFPAKEIIVTIPEALAAMGMTKADITGGDFFEFRLVLYTNDGRRFSNDNSSSDILSGAFYNSPFFYRLPVVCPSELAGEYNLSTTGWCAEKFEGKVKFIAGATTGTYIIQTTVGEGGAFVDDYSFGFYRACYGPTTAPPGGANGLRLVEACGKTSFNSSTSSPWGDNFFIRDVRVNGAVLELDIESSYPPEAGKAVITRTDGKNWPPLTK